MYLNSLRLIFSKINEIKLVFVPFERVLKFKLIVFHVITYLWHLWLNYHTFFAVRSLFLNHWDVVEKTFGFGSQYATVWNQVILQVYFNACLVMDIWEIKFADHYVELKAFMKKIMPYCFTSLVFPFSCVVAINFWTFYSIRHEIIDEDNVMHLYIPHWINHALHTTIIILVCIERILVNYSSSSRIWSFVGVCTLFISYAATCTVLYMFSGIWPYPLIRGMSNFGKITFVSVNCLLGIFFVALGEAINWKIWGTGNTAKMVETVKKLEKVS